MKNSTPLAALLFLASPAAADPALVANADGSVTLTAPIDSTPPRLLEPAPRPIRNAAHARARAEREAQLDRAFQEATADAREAARSAPPH